MGSRSTEGTLSRLARAAVAAVAVGCVLAPAPAAAGRTAQEPVTPAGQVVVVDARRCATAPSTARTRVVCTVAQAVPQLRDGSALVLAAGVHRGPLDLRGLRRLTVRGERGAVLSAGGARFALSLRDVRDVRVSSLQLRGGSAQTVWVERTSGVLLHGLLVSGSRGSGLQLRDSTGFRLVGSRVVDAASAGVMELTGVVDSSYERLVVSGNGRGAAVHDGDGLQLSGSGVAVRDVQVLGNGSDTRYEHGIYVSDRARSVLLSGVTSRGNAGVAVKLGGSGTLERSLLSDDRTALYCGTTADRGWTVRTTRLLAPGPVQRGPGCAHLRGIAGS